MNPNDYISLGKFLKKQRKKLGYTLENLADDHISQATISNIERGILGVSEEKVRYLCKQLNVEFSQYPKLLKKENDSQKKLLKTLLGIESLMDYLGSNMPFDQLSNISLDQDDPMSFFVYYLNGKYYYHQNKWTKAKDHFIETLQLLKQLPEFKSSNIDAACFKELGRISYFHEGDTEKALHFNNQGLNSFQSDGERLNLKYTLLVTQAFYLEKLNRNEEANRTLDLLWEEIDKIDNSDVKINMYELRSLLFMKNKCHDEARKYAERGIEIAREYKRIDRGFELWTSLGSICVKLKEFEEAEDYFLLALAMKDFVRKEYLLVSTHTQLGKLYLEQEKWELAKEQLETAVSIGEKSSDEFRYIEALEALGDYHLKNGNIKEAIHPYEISLTLAEKHGFPVLRHNCLVKLGYCYKEVNSPKYKECMEKSFEIALQSKLNSLINVGGN
ncbi:helix-turn-helix domain-containing protein [Risungbinella massiliensis]|uniref:helix-turn-helix domain-containing protein n=1 Tax=Risungbinella massiliensis TaxID=1329796 RepID=UPI0005CC1FF5|nr:tetratricopeptide repeat protein [Risungbinella massiliensis]